MKKKMMFLSSVLVPAYLLVGSKYLHDSECPRRLEHSTGTVHVQTPGVARNGEQSQIGAVISSAVDAGAVCISDAPERIDGTNKGADEQEVDKGNEFSRVPGACVEKESGHDPCCTEYRDDEENKNGCWSKEPARVVPIDEPGQHTQRRYEGDELEDAPKDEG